jgi:hypothetical protein
MEFSGAWRHGLPSELTFFDFWKKPEIQEPKTIERKTPRGKGFKPSKKHQHLPNPTANEGR